MPYPQQYNDEQSLEGYSIENPTPASFLPYDDRQEGPIVYDDRMVSNDVDVDKNNNNNNNHDDYDNTTGTAELDSGSDDDDNGYNVRHGRSPRFWLLLVGAIVIVAVAVGAGVGVAMSGGSTDDASSDIVGAANTNQQVHISQVGQTTTEITTTTPEDVGTSTTAQQQDGEDSEPETTSPTSEVFDIILTHARLHGVEFEDPNSYQSRAAKWVETTAVLGVHTPERIIQRYVLACLYYATNGVKSAWTDEVFGEGNPVRGWIDETGWLDDDDECSWYRISCDDNGMVAKIELHQNRLTGTLPSELALLHRTLQVIDLYQNPLHNVGDEGNHWLGELTKLKKLFFGRTYFEYDGIPTVISHLSDLEEFDCSYTLYNGPLQGESFELLSNLNYLHIGGNRYNSSIPEELASLPQLQFLYAEFADLTGDLSFVLDMPNIVELWVDNNPMLTGTIPSEIGLVSTLRSFSITECGFHGTIPPQVADLRLQQFWLYGNGFGGSMPDEVCATVYPEGKLMKLESECNAFFNCSCCTCCGDECAGTGSS